MCCQVEDEVRAGAERVSGECLLIWLQFLLSLSLNLFAVIQFSRRRSSQWGKSGVGVPCQVCLCFAVVCHQHKSDDWYCVTGWCYIEWRCKGFSAVVLCILCGLLLNLRYCKLPTITFSHIRAYARIPLQSFEFRFIIIWFSWTFTVKG